MRQIAVPDDARALSTLGRVDYADAFLVDIGAASRRHAEQLARVTLSGAPLELRTRLVTGWSAIGLKLRRGGRSILGWTIRESTPDVALLGADSRIGMPGELLFKREGGALLFCTFVQHETPIARATWLATEPIHVPTVRAVLTKAAARLR